MFHCMFAPKAFPNSKPIKGLAMNVFHHSYTALCDISKSSTFQTSMSAYPMKDWVLVNKIVPTQLVHFTAVVCLDIPNQDMTAMVRTFG